MPKLRVHNLAVSLDGYVAGPRQDLDNPLGVGATRLHEWVFATPRGRAIVEAGRDEGTGEDEPSIDERFIARGVTGIGATIMGRNMFGPVRGPWGEDEWTGWWGDNPPFHHPVFVLTHYPRPPITLRGGTTFHFGDGIEATLRRAFDAADGADVRLGGGAATVRQYLRAGLIDELHLAIVPILLGDGERPFADPVDGAAGYECAELVSSPSVAHVRLTRSGT